MIEDVKKSDPKYKKKKYRKKEGTLRHKIKSHIGHRFLEFIRFVEYSQEFKRLTETDPSQDSAEASGTCSNGVDNYKGDILSRKLEDFKCLEASHLVSLDLPVLKVAKLMSECLDKANYLPKSLCQGPESVIDKIQRDLMRDLDQGRAPTGIATVCRNFIKQSIQKCEDARRAEKNSSFRKVFAEYVVVLKDLSKICNFVFRDKAQV